MKILQINSSDTGGGAERVAYQIYRELKSIEGIESKFLVRKKFKNDKDIIELKRSVVDRTVTKLINDNLSLQGKVAIGSCKFNKVIFDNKFDIVHYHNIHGNYYNINNIKKISKNIPVVWTLHDMWSFTGRCAYSYDCIEWMNECGNCGTELNSFPMMKKDNSSRVLYEKRNAFLDENIYIVTPSKWLEGLVRKSFMKNMKITTIYNGVDMQVYKYNDKQKMRKKFQLNEEKIYLLLMSADINDERKGFKEIIEKINKIQDKDKFCILTVGRKLQDGIIDSKYDVKQFGYIKDEIYLNEIYSLADIFIMPTRADNFPCTILEAMSSGTPVLTYPVGGIVEQVDEEVGWLIDRNNDELFFNIIKNINKDECMKKGIKARKKIEEHFSIEKCIKNYLELYNSIIK